MNAANSARALSDPTRLFHRQTPRHVLAWLLAAIAVGAAVRVYLALTASVISRDGVVYVSVARRMVADWRAELPNDYPLGFPFLIRCTHAALGPHLSADPILAWQRSGQFVCVVSGLACIALVYWLGRRLLGTRCGLLAAWIWAMLPQAASLSADALTDMPHLTLVLASLACCMTGLRKRSLLLLAACGLLSGAAYTLRTEGAEMVVVAVLVLLFRRRLPMRWRAAALLAVLAGFAVIGGAYVGLEGGRVFNKQPWVLQDLATTHHMRFIHAGAADIGLLVLLEKLSTSLNSIWLVLGAAYLFLRRKRARRVTDALPPVLLWTLHVGALLFLFRHAGYISSRHVLLLNVAFVILSAGTLNELAHRVVTRTLHPLRNADAIAAAVIFLALTPWLLRDINFNRWYVRDCGRWIAQQYPDRPLPGIVSCDGWAPFYAGALNWAVCKKIDDLPKTPGLAGAGLLVATPREPPLPTLRITSAQLTFTEIKRFVEPDAKRGLIVYAIHSAAPQIP